MTQPTHGKSPIGPLVEAVGRPSAGHVGVVLARPGVGKTALLVHFGLEALFRGEQVLHVALRDTVDHARAHYDEVLRVLGARPADAALVVERNRTLHSWQGRPFDPSLVARSLDVLGEAAQFRPSLVLVDGYEAVAQATEHLPALRQLARERSVAVVASARSDDASDLVPGFDFAVRLEPQGRAVRLVAGGRTLAAALDPTSLLVLDEGVVRGAPDARVSPRECTLYAGGAAGAETAFGEHAEKWGMHEVNLTFDGHLQARTRGRYELSPKELAMGDVSLAYVSKRLNRTYSDRGGLIRGVLQTLWHMVARAQQVFVVGRIQDDGTVVGGTGWSVELARMWNRDLWVYDQDKVGWYRWDGNSFVAGTPIVTSLHVCGTGTRYLNDDGRAAIADLFHRSFGGH